MKKFTKYLALLCALLTVAFASAAFCACGSDSYTIYVKDANGDPYTDVKIQLCAVGGFCDPVYTRVDKNGKAVIPALHVSDPVTGQRTKETVKEVEVHLYTLDETALPGNITYEEVTVKLGGTVTVIVTVA